MRSNKEKDSDNIGVCYTMSPIHIENNMNIDNIILSRWMSFMNNGHFRYNIDSVQEKVLPGRFGFLVQFQPNRSTNRRPPQPMSSVRQKFNPDNFNFNKINKEKEMVAELCNLEDCGGESGDKSLLSRSKDIVIINVSPIDLGHCLLVPRVQDCQPQVLTEYGVKLALETMLLSTSPRLKIAFNSLCGYASVNHLHWHLYYQDHVLPVQRLGLTPVAGIPGVHTLESEQYPAPAWVWLMSSTTSDHVSSVTRVAQQVVSLTSWLTDKDIAHNVFITRSCAENEDSMLRLIVWPRDTVRGAKDPGDFVMAVCELSGQMLVYTQDKYGTIREQEIVTAMKKAAAGTFERIKPDVEALLSVALRS